MTDLPEWAKELVEPVAESIQRADPDYDDMRWSDIPERRKGEYRLSATAALADALPKIAEHLKDPNTVHVNMLRGDIAKPSIAQIVHIYGSKELQDYLAATYEPATAIRREVTPHKP